MCAGRKKGNSETGNKDQNDFNCCKRVFIISCVLIALCIIAAVICCWGKSKNNDLPLLCIFFLIMLIFILVCFKEYIRCCDLKNTLGLNTPLPIEKIAKDGEEVKDAKNKYDKYDECSRRVLTYTRFVSDSRRTVCRLFIFLSVLLVITGFLIATKGGWYELLHELIAKIPVTTK